MTEAQATILATVLGIGIGGAITFLVAWGTLKAKNEEVTRRMTAAELAMEGLHDRISNLSKEYVGYQHFNEVVQTLRENHKDLKTDIAKVMEAVSEQRTVRG